MKNEEFYQTIQLPRSEVHVLEKKPLFWVIFLCSNILGVMILPFSVAFKKGLELSQDHYFRLVSLGAIIAVLVNLVYFWSSEIVPYLNTRKGFFWRGTFTVVGKVSIKGSKYLLVKPGYDHRIKVKNEFFNTIHEYDRILVDRNYLGSR